jgi:hypothetical protein
MSSYNLTEMKAAMKSGRWDANEYAAEVAGTAWTPEDAWTGTVSSLDAMERRTANKKTYTAEEATERRQQMARSAGSSTLEAGIVLTRNNEVNEVKAAAQVPVPAGVALVPAAATARTASSELEVPCVVEWLEALNEAEPPVAQPPPAERRCFYALLSGHGGSGGEIAAWVCGRLPKLLAEKLSGVAPSESSAIKEGIKAAFDACHAELLQAAPERAWTGGCCALGLLLDLLTSPPRAYVASLGTSQAHACVKEEGSSAIKTIGVSKPKPGRSLGEPPPASDASKGAPKGGAASKAPPANPPPAKSGGPVPHPRSNARPSHAVHTRRGWTAARSIHAPQDGAVGGKGVASADVLSFDVKAAQRFVVLGTAGMWKGASGDHAVGMLATRLNMMDARRAEIEAMLGDDIRLAMQGAEKVKVRV